MDPHYDNSIWVYNFEWRYFSDGTTELYMEIWISQIWIMVLHNWISYMDHLWSYIIQLQLCKSKELDKSVLQLCNWFLEMRTL